ncbi:hypothetical protein [Fusicatenibacter saccharivorans]|nr:hypothetical protein [Fusicatenibacter saccharivorans]
MIKKSDCLPEREMQFSMYEKVISQKEEGEINGSKMDSGTAESH